MSVTDSAANFRARAIALGLDEAVLQKIVDGGIDTLAKFAFSSSYTPGAQDEKPFLDSIATLLGRDGSVGELSVLRRLFHESYSLTSAELKQSVERVEDGPVKRLAQPDRADRLAKQQKRLPGISIRGPLEPSDRLVDRCVAIYEENRLVYVELSACTSKEDEIKQATLKEDRHLVVESGGNVRLKGLVNNKMDADISSDLLMRYALTRRGLAMEQAGIISYTLHDAWTEQLLACRFREPPTGYSRVSLQQVIHADRQFFIKLAELTREGIQLQAKGRPCDLHFETARNHPDVAHLMQPLLAAVPRPDPTWTPRKGDGKNGKGGKGQKGGKGKRDTTAITAAMPKEIADGGLSFTPKGYAICWDYNLNRCKRRVGADTGMSVDAAGGASAEILSQQLLEADRLPTPEEIEELVSLLPHGELTGERRSNATALHADSQNAFIPNLVVPLNRFSGGGIWVESDVGKERLTVDGQELLGRRMVLIGYSVQGGEMLQDSDKVELKALGFALPSQYPATGNQVAEQACFADFRNGTSSPPLLEQRPAYDPQHIGDPSRSPVQGKFLKPTQFFMSTLSRLMPRLGHSRYSLDLGTPKGGVVTHPPEFCKHVVQAIARHHGLACPDVALSSTPAGVAQQKRGKPEASLLPEFGKVLQVDVDQVPPVNHKQCLTRPLGEVPAGSKLIATSLLRGDAGGDAGNEGKKFRLSLGVFATPDEFVDAAKDLLHPFAASAVLSPIVKRRLFEALTKGPEWVQRQRCSKLKLWLSWAKELQVAEGEMKGKLDPDIGRVLRGKRLLLLKRIADDMDWPDKDWLGELLEGFDLVGSQKHTGVFKRELRPQARTKADFLDASKFLRPALLGKVASEGLNEHSQELWDKTLEEVTDDLLEGPLTQEEVHARHGDHWVPVRRFPVVQSSAGKRKLRPIDDFSENLVNGSFSYADKIDLRALDEIIAICRCWTQACTSEHQFFFAMPEGPPLVGRVHPLWVSGAWEPLLTTFDLKNAYRLIVNSHCHQAAVLMRSLHCWIQFSDSQIMGRTGKLALAELRASSARHADKFRLGEQEVRAFDFLVSRLSFGAPRVVPCSVPPKPILVFTDGASEGSIHTVGGIMFDPREQQPKYFACHVCDSVVSTWSRDLQHIIGPVEAYAVLTARKVFHQSLSGQYCVYFIDNDGVLLSYIKGTSSSKPMRDILLMWESLEMHAHTWAWWARVPSASNPADAPSRGELDELVKAGALRVDCDCPLTGTRLVDL
ncbi:unnamed protein product [Symbiodinium sp. CCMP2592]|nr:unnamed protein product [Symbiodinium sp. CCMP2592]